MSDFVESILAAIAGVIIFLIDTFRKGEITIYEKLVHEPFSYKSFRLLVPVVALGKRKERLSETDESYFQLYFGNKISICNNKELGWLQIRVCVMGFGFQITKQLNY